MENLKALVHGRKLSLYQRSLAVDEFEKLLKSNKEANEFIIDIASLLKMDTDSVGYDGIQFSIDDFKDAVAEKLVISRFKVINEFPDMTCKIGDIIELPSNEWVYSDGSYCKDDYFETWSHIFERVKK